MAMNFGNKYPEGL